MSELKATTVYDAYWKANSVGEGTGIQVYIKSEADKVIAELKKACNSKDDWCLHTLKENRHQKYKRCLAKAEMCGNAYDKWMMKKANAIGLGKDGVAYYLEARRKVSHYMRWHKRWLKIAEQFKEA